MGWAESLTTENLVQALREGQLDWPRAREEIFNDFDRALTASEREALLGLHKCLMDAVEQTIDPASLDKFKTARAQDYRLLLIKEAAIGSDSKYLNPARLAAITTREVNAGRQSADDDFHKDAVSGGAVVPPQKATDGIASKLRNWLGS